MGVFHMVVRMGGTWGFSGFGALACLLKHVLVSGFCFRGIHPCCSARVQVPELRAPPRASECGMCEKEWLLCFRKLILIFELRFKQLTWENELKSMAGNVGGGRPGFESTPPHPTV